MKDRLKQIRKNHPNGKTQDTFAEYLGVTKQNISSYEVGRRNPSDAFIQLICEKCNVNEEWLRTGQGDMFVKQSRNEQMKKLSKQLLSEEEDSFKNRLISTLANLTEEQWKILAEISENLSMEPTQPEKTVAELEEEYKKTISHSASKTDSPVSNITDGTRRTGRAVGEE